jgi:predicted dehydrogenase
MRIPGHTSDYRAICRDPGIEAVIVATPPHLHHAMALAALEAGKHVLCEKPMARNLAESRDMQRIADRVGAVAMVNFQHRFLPVRQRVKMLIDEGFLGEPRAATVVVHHSSLNDPHGRAWGWLMEQDKAGGMLGASGAHYVDNLRWWFGEVKGVAGALATLVPHRRLPDSSGMAKVDADDNVAVILRFANGALGTVHVSATTAVDDEEELLLSGSRGVLRIRNGLLVGAREGEIDLREMAVSDPVAESPTSTVDHPLVAPTVRLHRAWAEAIRIGRIASPSFADGVKVQEILDAVARSSQQGRWIDTSGQRWPLGS